MKGGPPDEKNEAPSRNGASFFFASSVSPPAYGVQLVPKNVVILEMSKMSLRSSVGSGAMSWRASAGGIDSAKSLVSRTMSKMSERPSLVISAGQASVPQARAGFVPIDASAPSLQPSQALQPV